MVMLDTDDCRKVVLFDLNTKALESVFGKGKAYKGYAKIESFFKKNNFEHRQRSVYVSKEPMSDNAVFSLALAMYKEFPWLTDCTNWLDCGNALESTFELHSRVLESLAENDIGTKELGMVASRQLSLNERLQMIKEASIEEESTNSQEKSFRNTPPEDISR